MYIYIYYTYIYILYIHIWQPEKEESEILLNITTKLCGLLLKKKTLGGNSYSHTPTSIIIYRYNCCSHGPSDAQGEDYSHGTGADSAGLGL